jgi:nucleoside-diphosphate-sugar epimerase
VGGGVVKNRPVDVVLSNIIGTKNCLDFAQKQKDKYGVNPRVVIFSSYTIYLNEESSDLNVSEEMTTCVESLNSPMISYSESKRMSEVIATSYFKQHGTDVVITRFSTVYGYTHYAQDTAIYEFIRKALNGEEITINKAGLPHKDHIYVVDAVEGLLTVAKYGVSGEAYNISSNGDAGNFVSVDEIAQAIVDATAELRGKSSQKIKVGDGTPFTDRIPGLRLDNSKLKDLGWSIKTNLKDGVKETIELMQSIAR